VFGDAFEMTLAEAREEYEDAIPRLLQNDHRAAS
jgi:hypothetical protein